MKVSIIGTHGIPATYGGFETFAEHLAAACVKKGMEVTVINERDNPLKPIPENVRIISSSFNKKESTLKFYKDSLKLAAGSDIILSCGVGGAFFYSQLRKMPVKIITNVDGLEHLRKKYSLLQRMFVYILQSLAAKNSDYLIADSNAVKNYWTMRFPKKKQRIKMISYGADECLPFDQEVLLRQGLERDDYFLVIARLVPENNLHTIIDAFSQYIGKKKLVITGQLEKSGFVSGLKRNSSDKIIFTDAIYDKRILDSLRQGCFVYIHGHSVGGTNPSLLEAMTAGCACICHDNIFNREVTGGSQLYFRSSFDLGIMMNLLDQKKVDLDVLKEKSKGKIAGEYTWEKVCNSYIDLFRGIDNRKNNNQPEEKRMDKKDISIIPFTDQGFDRLVELSKSTYAGREIADPVFLGWEYIYNPDGLALINVAEEDRKIIAQYIVVPRVYSINNKIVHGSLSVNTLTHPGYKGQGLFPRLTEKTFNSCAEKEIYFTCGFPNPVSSPVIEKKKIFETIGFMPLLFMPLNPIASMFRYFIGRKNKTGEEIELKIPEGINSSVNDVSLFDFKNDAEKYEEFLGIFNREKQNVTFRSLQFLMWRYVNIPIRKYNILKYEEDNKMRAILVFRARYMFGMRCGIIIDLAAHSNEKGVENLAVDIKRIAKMNRLDMIIATFPEISFESHIMKRNGFYSMPQRFLPQKLPFIVKRHLPDCPEDVIDFKKWFLTFGDYDIF